MNNDIPKLRAEIRALLLKTFERDEFEILLQDKFNLDLDQMVPRGLDLVSEFNEVLLYFERRHTLYELVKAARDERASVPQFKDLVQRLFALTSHLNAPLASTSGGSSTESSPLPQVSGLQASTMAASLGEQTIDAERAIERQGELTRQICLIESSGRPIGTGFLITASHILTCWHVLTEALQHGKQISAVFDFVDEQDFASLPRQSVDIDRILVHEGDRLDYGVVPLLNAESERGWIQLSRKRMQDKSSVLVLGHPVDGQVAKPLQLTWGIVRDINDHVKRIAYTAQTGPGSSGSPVFNANFELVALHHHGQMGVNNHGIPTHFFAEAIENALAGTPYQHSTPPDDTPDRTARTESSGVQASEGVDGSAGEAERVTKELRTQMLTASSHDLEELLVRVEIAARKYPECVELQMLRRQIENAMRRPAKSVRRRLALLVTLLLLLLLPSTLVYYYWPPPSVIQLQADIAAGPPIEDMGKDFTDLRSKGYNWVYQLKTNAFAKNEKTTQFLLSVDYVNAEMEVRGCVVGKASSNCKSQLNVRPSNGSAAVVRIHANDIDAGDHMELIVGVKNHPEDGSEVSDRFRLMREP